MQLAGQHKAWNMKTVNNILVGSLKERPLGRPRSRWKDNIKRTFRKYDDVSWNVLTQRSDQWLSVVKTVVNLRAS
jgi:hypothetical protein